jgi:hypothetical protein
VNCDAVKTSTFGGSRATMLWVNPWESAVTTGEGKISKGGFEAVTLLICVVGTLGTAHVE